ncbi:hypothetical protein QEN19_004077 [Hanseniaspora menglaensis]
MKVLTCSLFCLLIFGRLIAAFVHPIVISNKYFTDSVTQKPFFLKGLDYQPGGSGAINLKEDPLSNPDKCLRDIVLMQDLGVNTIRVYSVNPDLDHNKCMTLLAKAGIYLVLDVNSPLPGQHLNRYEPWTTYSSDYLEHVFKVVDVFSRYNNTLAFFSGNEIVNDKKSARNSPPYIKQLISDMKQYMKKNSPRIVPVGYSAADDLRFRIPLSKYLACEDKNYPLGSVDFYGVNTYQWCGHQTFKTSGYDKLTEAYKEFTKPVFFSEFGCNEVTPRQFEEIESIYSASMFTTFSGGLVYEYSLEPNKYGLVEINDKNKSITILEDFKTLKSMYSKVQIPSFEEIKKVQSLTNPETLKKPNQEQICKTEYENIDISKQPSTTLAKEFIDHGVDLNHTPNFVKLELGNMNRSDYTIYDVGGKKIYLDNNQFKFIEKVDISDVSSYEPKEDDKTRQKNKRLVLLLPLLIITKS